VTSVSVIGPTADKIIFVLMFSILIFSIALAKASRDPLTSVFKIILYSSSGSDSPKYQFFVTC